MSDAESVLAAFRKLPPEEKARVRAVIVAEKEPVSADEIGDAEFQGIVERVLARNAELYRRLA